MADISPTTASATFNADEVPLARAKVWKETFKKFASTADVLTPLEGPEGSGASIGVRNDIKGRRGDRIEFTASSELGAFGVLGENTLKGNEEDLKFSGTTCVLEFKRHATAITASLKKKMAGGHTLESLAAEVLGNHFGQWKQRDALRRLIDGVRGSGANAKAITAPFGDGALIGTDKSVISAASSESNMLTALDTLGPDSFLELNRAASWLGVDPARITRNGYPSSQDTYHHCLLADNQMLKPLFKDNGFRASLQHAELRGATNPLFTGDLKEFDGTKILNLRSVYGDLNGPIGSPLTPAARLKGDSNHTISTSSGNSHLVGHQGNRAVATGNLADGVTQNDPNYFIDFPGYDYQYTADQDESVDNNLYYVAIYNPSGSGMVVSYNVNTSTSTSGNVGNKGDRIEIKNRISGVTPAGVDSSDAASKIEDGALAYPCNQLGVVYGYVILMGQDAVIRAYGENMTMIDDKDDYGFSHGIGYQAMFGDAVWKDRNDRVRNYVLGVYAYTPVGAR